MVDFQQTCSVSLQPQKLLTELSASATLLLNSCSPPSPPSAALSASNLTKNVQKIRRVPVLGAVLGGECGKQLWKVILSAGSAANIELDRGQERIKKSHQREKLLKQSL